MKPYIYAVALLMFLPSCQNEPSLSEEDQNVIDEETLFIDNEAKYLNQTDKAIMLGQLITFQSGEYVLDLSREDAISVGIEESLYDSFLERVEQLNNTN